MANDEEDHLLTFETYSRHLQGFDCRVNTSGRYLSHTLLQVPTPQPHNVDEKAGSYIIEYLSVVDQPPRSQSLNNMLEGYQGTLPHQF